MKATKKKLLATLIASCVLSGAAATAGLAYNASAALTETATSGINSFEMVYGASVRKTAGSLGIRFTATFDETLYNAVKDDANKEFGMLITNNEWVETYCTSGDYIADLLNENNYILITESEADEEAGNQLAPYVYKTDAETCVNTYAINGVVANVQYAHSDWAWFGIGVVITTDGSTKTYEYADFVKGDNVRTVAEVASAALEYEALSDTQRSNLMEYVYSTAYDVQGVSKADYEAKTEEEKAAELATFSLTADSTEYYATLGEDGVETSTTASNGEVSFPVRAKWETSDEDVATVNKQGILEAAGRGYAVLTPTSSIGLTASATSATAYTGETTLITQNMKNAPLWSSVGSVGQQGLNGTIDGEEYVRWGKGTSTEANYYAFVPSDISSNYLAYMKEQGYAWVRSRVYFANENVEDISFRVVANVNANGGTQKFNNVTLPTDQWMSVDIPLDFYLGVYWNNGNGIVTEGASIYVGVNEYGMITTNSGNWRAPFVITTNYTTAYWGDVTLVKDNVTTLTVRENNIEAKFAEAYDLSKQFSVAEGEATYTVDGKDYTNENLVPVFSKYKVNMTVESILNVDVTLPVANSTDIVFTKPTAVATLNVTNGLTINPVNLVNTEGTYDIDTLTGKKALEAKGLTAECSIVKRYSDGTPLTTLDVANAESGIYYYNITAKKDGVAICNYDTTIDLYKASEGCEYENFRHTDSEYAVKSYYGYGAWMETLDGTNWAVSSEVLPMQTAEEFFDASPKSVAFGTGEDENTYYALSLGQCSDNTIANYKGRTVGYLEYDWTVEFQLEKYYQYIFTYVLPRHTAEYYQLHSDTYGKMAMTFKGTYTETSLRTIHPVNVNENGISLYYGRTYSDNNQGTAMQDVMAITVDTVADYYEAFANEQIPMQIIYSPYSFKTGTARLYEMFFVANA